VNEKPTVLVVEDEAADVFMMQRAVRKINAPIKLQVVNNGEEATDYLLGQGRFGDREVYPLPRLILLDIKMPRKNGFEVLEWVKGEASLRDIPVVMVTSSTVTSDVDQAYGLGASAYLVKPVEIDVLRELFTSTDDFLHHQHIAVQG
jgi:CheY-like chemotaxis protein